MIIQEAFRTLRRSPVTAVLTSVTIGVSLGILALVLYLSHQAERSLVELKRELTVNVFFSTDLSSREAYDGPYEAITSGMIRSISRAEFSSREEAAQNYFASTGEDVIAVLGFNPLPASVAIYPWAVRSDSLQALTSRMEKVEGVEDIRYDGELLQNLEQHSKALQNLAWLLVAVLGAATLMLSAVNTRLVLGIRRETIRTLQLLGAYRRQIYGPYLIEGLLSGLFGGLLACGVWLLLWKYVRPLIGQELMTGTGALTRPQLLLYCGLLITAGGVAGLLGSSFAAWRVMRKGASN